MAATTTLAYATEDYGDRTWNPDLLLHGSEATAQPPILGKPRAPRIGFTQLLPPLLIAWIGNCNNTNVEILPTALARVIQAMVLMGLFSMSGGGGGGKSTAERSGKRSRVLFSFFVQALCILLVIDLLRIDPREAHELVSTTDWRRGTGNLFRR